MIIVEQHCKLKQLSLRVLLDAVPHSQRDRFLFGCDGSVAMKVRSAAVRIHAEANDPSLITDSESVSTKGAKLAECPQCHRAQLAVTPGISGRVDKGTKTSSSPRV